MPMVQQTADWWHPAGMLTGKVHHAFGNDRTLTAYNTLWPAQGPFAKTCYIILHKWHDMRVHLTGDGVIDIIKPRHFLLRKITAHTAIDSARGSRIRSTLTLIWFSAQSYGWNSKWKRTRGSDCTPHPAIW